MSATLDHLLTPLRRWLDDPAVEEICIQKPSEAWIYAAGRFERFDVDLDADEIEDIGIVAAAQRRQDVGHDTPLLATDLLGRGRLQVVLYPCVGEECPSLTIRRGSTAWPSLDSLGATGLFRATQTTRSHIADEALTTFYRKRQWRDFLRLAVQRRKTIVICGENASGKTHVAKSLLKEIPLHERLITIEDAPELRGLPHPNSVSLYYDKDGNIKAANLVEAALRMRIGRLFLQEIRDGAAAIAFLVALQTGHAGGITTIHASHCAAVFDRLRVLIKQTPSGAAVSDADITSQLHALVDIVVHSSRDGDSFAVDEVLYKECLNA